MTNEQIMKLMEGLGLHEGGVDNWYSDNAWVKFARLIIAAERQRKAWDAEYWTEYEHDVAAAEREACAALCFQMWNKWLDSEDRSEFTRPDAEDCAEAIRARGQG
jgi:hypothetical protein